MLWYHNMFLMALGKEIVCFHHVTKGFHGGLLTLDWPSYYIERGPACDKRTKDHPPGEVLIYVRVMGRLRGIDPPFFVKTSTLDPPFSAPIDLRVSGSQGAYLPPSLRHPQSLDDIPFFFVCVFSKSDIRALPVSNLSAAPVMHGCIPARGGFQWVVRFEFSAD